MRHLQFWNPHTFFFVFAIEFRFNLTFKIHSFINPKFVCQSFENFNLNSNETGDKTILYFSSQI